MNTITSARQTLNASSRKASLSIIQNQSDYWEQLPASAQIPYWSRSRQVGDEKLATLNLLL